MRDEVGVAVLPDGLPQQGTQAEIGTLNLGLGQCIDREATQPHKPGTVDEQISPPCRRGPNVAAQIRPVPTPGVGNHGVLVIGRQIENDQLASSGKSCGVHTDARIDGNQ